MDAALLFVDVKEIKRLNMRNNHVMSFMKNMKRAVALDFDARAGKVYFTDVTDNKIYSSLFHNQTKSVDSVSGWILNMYTVVLGKTLFFLFHPIHNESCCLMWGLPGGVLDPDFP